jgi:hypothetical protein
MSLPVVEGTKRRRDLRAVLSIINLAEVSGMGKISLSLAIPAALVFSATGGEESGCAGCHHQPLTARAQSLAKARVSLLPKPPQKSNYRKCAGSGSRCRKNSLKRGLRLDAEERKQPIGFLRTQERNGDDQDAIRAYKSI